MRVFHDTIDVPTQGRGLYDVTAAVRKCLAHSGIQEGLCTVFVQHTSASLVVQENADPAVRRDLEKWMERLAPEDASAYEHDAEGPDDMPAHLRSAVTRTSETIPVRGGALALGTWQAVYLWEHRTARHTRRVLVTVIGSWT